MSSQGVTQSRSNTDRIIAASLLAERNLIEGKNAYDGDSPFTGLSTGGRNIVSPTGNFLSKSGDVRLGPMGDEHTFQPILNGIIDVSTNERYNFPWIFLTPEDGINDDDLETIIQGADVRPNQILYIQTGTANVTITVKNTGNIMTLNNEDVLLSFGLVAELRYSQLLGVWVMMNVNTGGGGSGEENRIFQGNSSVTVNDAAGPGGVINFAVDGMPVGSFTERFGLLLQKNLNMGDSDILGVGDVGFNVTGQGFVSSTTGIDYVVPTGDAHDFFIENINKLKISVDVVITANTLLDGNLDMLADDSTIIHLHNLNFIQENQSIQSTATGLEYHVPEDDTHAFFVDSVHKLSILSNRIELDVDLDMDGNSITNIDDLSFEDSKHIRGSPSGFSHTVPFGDVYDFLINGNKVVVIEAAATTFNHNIDMNDNDIAGIGDLIFQNTGSERNPVQGSISGSSLGLFYDVGSGGIHQWQNQGVGKMSLNQTTLSLDVDIDMDNNDIDFGSGILKFSVNRGEIQGGLDSDGSIRVMIGNTTYKIPVFL